MLYVGIDVASEKHDCCIYSDMNIVAQFSFENSESGFDLLLSHLTESPKNTYIGMEATGIYGLNLVAFLRRKGFDVCTFNPLLVKRRHNATTLRNTKTDKVDAKFIAMQVKSLAPVPDTSVSYHISELKSLSRYRFDLVKECSAEKTRCKGSLILVFPEFIGFFSDCFGATATAILNKYPSARDIANCSLSAMSRLMEKSSRGRFGKEKASQLIALAKHSVGNYSETEAMKIQFSLTAIALRQKQITILEERIKAIMNDVETPVTTIPGVGMILGSMIISEIGDIHRFSSYAKLLAFAGLDPSISQSGKSNSEHGSMVKHGSPYLRWALIQAARYAAMNNPVFEKYFKKKISESKHYNVAISHVAKKLVRILFTLMTKNIPFDADFCY